MNSDSHPRCPLSSDRGPADSMSSGRVVHPRQRSGGAWSVDIPGGDSWRSCGTTSAGAGRCGDSLGAWSGRGSRAGRSRSSHSRAPASAVRGSRTHRRAEIGLANGSARG